MEWEHLRPALNMVIALSDASAPIAERPAAAVAAAAAPWHIPTAKQLFDRLGVGDAAGHAPLVTLLQCVARPLIMTEMRGWIEHHHALAFGSRPHTRPKVLLRARAGPEKLELRAAFFRWRGRAVRDSMEEISALCLALIWEESGRSLEYLSDVLRDLLSEDPTPGTGLLFRALDLSLEGFAVQGRAGYDVRTARGVRRHLRARLIGLLRLQYELACELLDPPLRWDSDVLPALEGCHSEQLGTLLRCTRDEFLACLAEGAEESAEESAAGAPPGDAPPPQAQASATMRLAVRRERQTVQARLRSSLDAAGLLARHGLEWETAELDWQSSCALLPALQMLEASLSSVGTKSKELRGIFGASSVEELFSLSNPGAGERKLRKLLASKLVLLAHERIGKFVASDAWHGLLREDVTDLSSLVSYWRDPDWLLEDGLSDALRLWATATAPM